MRIPLVDPEDPSTDPDVARMLRERARAGRDSNVYKALANHPAVMAGLLQFGPIVYSDNSLPVGERELAFLATSVTNDCYY